MPGLDQRVSELATGFHQEGSPTHRRVADFKIEDLLGHTQISTTDRYIHASAPEKDNGCDGSSDDPVVRTNPAAAYHPPVELYDLAPDPWAQQGVADQLKYAAVRRELLRRLQQHMVAIGDSLLLGALTSPHHRKSLKWMERISGG